MSHAENCVQDAMFQRPCNYGILPDAMWSAPQLELTASSCKSFMTFAAPKVAVSKALPPRSVYYRKSRANHCSLASVSMLVRPMRRLAPSPVGCSIGEIALSPRTGQDLASD